VQVDEPSEKRAILMMRGVASTLEKHHRVQVLDEALEAAVKLSHRYIPSRQLPDKSVSLLDTAAARVAVSQHAVPAEVDDTRKRIEALETELAIIGREEAVGIEAGDRRKRVEEALERDRATLVDLEARWQDEKGLVEKVLAIRAKLRGNTEPVEGTESDLEKAAEQEKSAGKSASARAASGAASSGTDSGSASSGVAAPDGTGSVSSAMGATGGSALGMAEARPVPTGAEREALMEELRALQSKLNALQGEAPLILPSVDAQAVASVVADWTGIPVGRMVKNEVEAVLKLADTIGKRVIGQDHAIQMIARRIQTSRAQLDNPNKPIGVFLLAGPSGVGKTETALALAEALYGGEQNVITINMSEFQEAHTVSTLKGAPPGYVGYGEGGVLTEAVRRKPYSVVLLDEVEKAHSDVHEIFFQVFDKGMMEDGEGRLIDFKNTLILLTSNVGSDLIMSMCKDPDLLPEPEGIAKALREPLLKVFPAALLGRLVTIPYYPLSDEMIGNIARLQLSRIQRRVEENHRVPFVYDDAVIQLIVGRCTELESGGRMIDAILTNTMLPSISRHFLERMVEGQPVERVHVSVADGDFAYSFGA
jgi:type VI secretion system protein VasG